MYHKIILPIARFLVSMFGFNEQKHLLRSFSLLPSNDGLSLIDVGAAGGVEKRWQAVIGELNYYGFEPDERSYKELSSHLGARSATVHPYALWSEEKEISVNLCHDPQTSSVYEPNRSFLDKFPIPERFDVKNTFLCRAKCLDQFEIKSPHFIKMDIQGGELDVLKGSRNTLAKNLGMEIEVEMLEMYNGQPLFGEVVDFLVEFDLEFIDFVGTRRWLRNEHADIGQFIFADALFLKSPEIVSTDVYSKDEKINYLKILLIYRRFDLIDKYIQLSDEETVRSLKGFVSGIKPIRRNFNRINRLNKAVSMMFRFFGVNYKSHLIY